ncbi:restriction endonuclease subunit S [Psychrosphaera ytuae]|uniref:Restriction endonuclease subunit S n=1 Tax=Psychrosphaera ytuae TaxID=2820710 RepID=A0A975DCW7_9GAMM|nr:restriction endonuclease subunit S [Psychrosphaera ytuae]QTH63340.1 restriction endonuclease subunit S [Psychrosphaera ytuae]
MFDMEAIKNFSIDKSDWKKVKFGDVVFEPKESVKDPVTEGIEHVVGLEHIDSGDMNLRRSASIEGSTTFTKKFCKGDVLFGRRRAYLKKAAKAGFEGICSGDITVMRAREALLLPELLPFVVNNEKFFDHAVTHSAGGLSPRVKFKDLSNFEFLLPNIEKQQYLLKLLREVSQLLEVERNLLSNLQILFNSSEKELFNGKGFNKEGILEVASVQRGKFAHRPRNAPQFYGGKIPFIQTSEVVNSDKYITSYSQTLNELGLSISKMFPKGTIVMTIAANIGYVGLLSFDSAFTDSLVGIQAKPEKISQEYLYYYLNYKQKIVDGLATESAQKNLSIDTFKAFKVRYPESKEKQLATVNQLDKIKKNINAQKTKIESVFKLQSILISKVF